MFTLLNILSPIPTVSAGTKPNSNSACQTSYAGCLGLGRAVSDCLVLYSKPYKDGELSKRLAGLVSLGSVDTGKRGC